MLRRPRRRELKVLLSALRAFGSLDFLEENEILLNEKKEAFALSKDLAKFLDLHRLNYVHAGIKVGEVGSRRFRFSLYAANRPPGPAPTIMTSYFIHLLALPPKCI